MVDPNEGGWTYYTPSTTDLAHAKFDEGFWAEDESWFVCVLCEPAVAKDDLTKLVARWVIVNAADVTILAFVPDGRGGVRPASGLEFATSVLKSFMQNKNQERLWEDIVTPGPAPTG